MATANQSTQTLALGAAVALGGLFLWNKFKTPTVTAVTDTGAAVNVPLTASGAIDTTSAAYLTAVANGVQSYVANASTPANCTMTAWGPVCPTNYNNPTLSVPTNITTTSPVTNTPSNTPLTCGYGWKPNASGTACIPAPETLTPPTPSIIPTTPEWQQSNSTQYEEVCDNGALLRRPKGSGAMASWTVVGSCVAVQGSTAPKANCKQVSHPYKEGVLDMVNLGPGGIPNRYITPPTPAWTEIVCS